MKSILLKSSVNAIVLFIICLIIKKYVLEEVIDNKSIITLAITSVSFTIIFVFFNRKKQSSNDN
jgi:hypothetical protein